MSKNSGEICNLQEFTRLPLKVVEVANRMLPDIFLETPLGRTQVQLKKEFYPFIFGSVSQVEKHLFEVIKDIREIEEEAKIYLLNEWLNGRKETKK